MSDLRKTYTHKGVRLKVGGIYTFHHKTKGTFVAKVLKITNGVEAGDGKATPFYYIKDKLDPVMIQVIYDIRAGTDQARLAGSELKAAKSTTRLSQLRPSFIKGVRKFEGNSYLREVALPEQDKDGFLKSVGKLLSGG